MTAYDDFLVLIEIETDDCVLWPHGLVTSTGYGKLKLGGRTLAVHVLALEWREPKPAPGRASQAAHSCRNKHCVNYRHLSWKTPSENAADRKRDGTELYGEQIPNSKLSEEQVAEIRRRYPGSQRGTRNSANSQAALAHEFGVSQPVISAIILRKWWKHVI